jgi:hypothetical protein
MIVLGLAVIGCSGGPGDMTPSSSEVATSVVSGALSNGSGTALGWNTIPFEKKSLAERLFDQLEPIGTAFAARWSCTGDKLTPAFAGPGSYSWTPVSCSVTWGNGKTASSKWSGDFTFNYGNNCDDKHRWIGNQAPGCSVTRTTAGGGNTRTITGPDGDLHEIDHDTNGADTGWDSTVTPAPNNGGVLASCTSSAAGAPECDAGTLTINGSHVTGTVEIGGGAATKIWDHTLTTATPLSVTRSRETRTVRGTVTVQHNLAEYTATSTFSVTYTAGCCFPTSGTVTTTRIKSKNGAGVGDTETLSFTNACGESILSDSTGAHPLTLKHCL